MKNILILFGLIMSVVMYAQSDSVTIADLPTQDAVLGSHLFETETADSSLSVTKDILQKTIRDTIIALEVEVDANTTAVGLNTTHRGLTNDPHSVTATQVGLGSVENTALSTWGGTTNIVTLGIITNGTWRGSAVQPTWGGTGLTSISTLLNSNTTAANVGLGSVENTALSTWAGTTNITTLGTIATGVWQGTAIGATYIGDLSATYEPQLVNEAGLYSALSDVTNFLQSGDALAGSDITDNTILEAKVNSTNAPTDNYVLSYNQAGTNFTWVAQTGGSSVVTDLTGTAHRVLYVNGSGDVTELAYGADGTYLRSNGAASNPTFTTPSGSGDMLAANNLSDVVSASTSLTNLGLTATAAEINTPLDGASVTLTEFQELETIGATTLSAPQWAGLGGATTAGIALWDDATAAAQLITLGLTATVSEINTPLDGASVTLTEFQELETIGATTISANQWAALGGIAETLTSSELDLLDGVTTTSTQFNYLNAATGTTGTASTNLVFSTSPTLVTPALGTPSALVGTNISGTGSGFTAGNVTTNANTTGDITGTGNSTAITAGVIVEADLDGTNAPTDNYILSYNQAGTNFTWVVDATGGTPATADISDVSVTQTEFAELETIGDVTISADQWATLGGAIPYNAQTGTTYTFVLGDADDFVTLSNAAAITATVPPNSSVAYPVGTMINCAQIGAGAVTFAEGSGVTINSFDDDLVSGGQWATFTLLKTATDVWLLMGRL